MKRLGLALAAVLLSVSVSYAKGNDTKLNKEPFAANFEKLSSYLNLAPYQMNDVADINNYFIERQNESFSSNTNRQEKNIHQAVYENLKLMKNVLTPEQYRKYLVLINITNNNNQIMAPNAYLADYARK